MTFQPDSMRKSSASTATAGDSLKTGCAEACETRRAARVRANERRILLILRPGWGLPLRRRAERERRQEFTVFGPALAMLFFFDSTKGMRSENDAGRDE